MNEKYGYFSDDGSEYVITRPDTPRPWVNYLTNGDYAALCSHAGGGFSFYLDHRFNSILRRGRSQAVEDTPGRLFYVKDEETGEFWNPNAFPLGKYDAFEARHGMGYTKISSSYSGVEADMRFFVPVGLPGEIWELQLRNQSGRARKLSIYSMAELVLGNVSLDEMEPTFMSLFNDARVEGQAIIAGKKWWHPRHGWQEENGEWKYRVVVTTPVKPQGLSVDRDDFIGPFHSVMNPAALSRETLSGKASSGKDLAAAFQWRVSLAPGQTWKTRKAIVIQPNEDSDENTLQLQSLQDLKTYEPAWERTREHWRRMLSAITFQVPDGPVQKMMSHWNKYQMMVNFYFGRGPSFYHKGQYPAMRDSCQDAFGVIALQPELAQKNLRRVAGFFFADGRACGGCNRIGLPEGPSEKVDLPLWLVLAVTDYLRETGDFAFLDERLPLVDGGKSTLFEKMIAGIDRMIQDSGSHGLPLIGKGDWNDAANMIGVGGKGESVWLAQFLYFVINEIAPLLEKRGEKAKKAEYLKHAEAVKLAVNEHCWDGQWFIRAFKDDGTPVGAAGQAEASIWINSQTWAVISGISTPERLNACMDSVEKHLGTPYGLMNLAPAFSKIDESIGIITRFLGGWKENAAVFSHASSFNVVARAMLGRGKDAVDLFKRILPVERDSDLYKMEPYVYSQFTVGPASPAEFGRGAYHWLTGTSAWMFRAMTDHILGVKPEYEGLRISPSVDPSWKGFSIHRRFRDADYQIYFENPDGVETGVKEMWLDGVSVTGNLLPLPTQKEHKVRVRMGK